eukprot:TRINITY_DN12171_c0_g1_i1.p2 TRINITY_DN12171_c0_g1~~TRINITY_DN12171_c0_g1_i1.p2  ORF type:complete len:167 (-),score=4.06 TRINITY_DN12171_c0_g1_i1:226-726(-)
MMFMEYGIILILRVLRIGQPNKYVRSVCVFCKNLQQKTDFYFNICEVVDYRNSVFYIIVRNPPNDLPPFFVYNYFNVFQIRTCEMQLFVFAVVLVVVFVHTSTTKTTCWFKKLNIVLSFSLRFVGQKRIFDEQIIEIFQMGVSIIILTCEFLTMLFLTSRDQFVCM